MRHHPDEAFWSVTRDVDIMAVDTNYEVFASEPSITIFDPKEDCKRSRDPTFRS